jgi:NADPH-dependent glutamate synthase beta subunit-like oxidoreductase/dihydroorotate dehydrogenase/Pyruvate/2-oxoacid:ferredoxin oxidoreductase delta subunit
MNEEKRFFLTDAQLKYEMEKCENCEEKPCRDACPSGVSPMDFILACKVGLPSDYKRAAARIMTANPLGGICGITCPDRLCMAACVYKDLNSSVKIPAVQATIIQKAKDLGVMPSFGKTGKKGKKVAVIGAGPAGLGAAAFLARLGYSITIFEEKDVLGGMCHLIPESRLPGDVVQSDIEFLLSLGDIKIEAGEAAPAPMELLKQGFAAVGVCVGLDTPIGLGLENEDLAAGGLTYLEDPAAYPMTGRVAVVGGGATALDSATTAVEHGAGRVELIALENLSEMPLAADEREALLEYNIEVSGRTRVTDIMKRDGKVAGVRTINVALAPGKEFSLSDISDIPENMATELDSFLEETEVPLIEDPARCAHPLDGYDARPVSLESDFFGRAIRSPFLLSAAPPTDGLDQMRLAYEAGWAGGIMKTAFDGLPIHIPGQYMHLFDRSTYGNCDNVSGHSLDRVCGEVEILIKEYPDRLTAASTGGPVTGDDESDSRSWQENTRKLEAAGAMAIEYSLSCPQGGEGTEGDIVSQNAALTAKIISWIMDVSDPEIPKIFKLTGAVTSIEAIMIAIGKVLENYPGKKAGVTLANTFPTLMFRPGNRPAWDEGIVVGMSGEGVLPISYLTIAKAACAGVAISGNGGPMDYKAAADFLALGAKTVQFCTLVMKYGYSVIDHIEEGVSHLMEDRGIGSMPELIGRALPEPITDFMDLSATKAVSDVHKELCLHCGNCTRCPYLAINLDEEKVPETDASKCIGCGICALKCFSQALYLRERTEEETAALSEH